MLIDLMLRKFFDTVLSALVVTAANGAGCTPMCILR